MPLTGCAADAAAARFRPRGETAAAAAAERRLLRGLVVDDRLQVVDDGLQLAVARLAQIALRLDDEEAAGHAGLELLLFRFEPLLGERARRAGGFDALARWSARCARGRESAS